jgi:hypothetical protein
MSITSKEKFKKYYKNIWSLLYSESSKEKEYNFIKFNKQYNIKFKYGVFDSSLFINNNRIYIYLCHSNLDFQYNLKSNGIDEFKKYDKLTYEQLLLLFRKIKLIINS